MAELVPLDRILLETDSPALHPIKGPGLRNEPKNLMIACEEVAKVKKTTKEEIARMTTENAKKLFPNAFQ